MELYFMEAKIFKNVTSIFDQNSIYRNPEIPLNNKRKSKKQTFLQPIGIMSVNTRKLKSR
jgi:hypothetical protein